MGSVGGFRTLITLLLCSFTPNRTMTSKETDLRYEQGLETESSKEREIQLEKLSMAGTCRTQAARRASPRGCTIYTVLMAWTRGSESGGMTAGAGVSLPPKRTSEMCMQQGLIMLRGAEAVGKHGMGVSGDGRIAG